MSKRVTVQHFAKLRDEAKCVEESVATGAADLRALYAQLATRHRFSLPDAVLKPVSNNQLVAWDHPLHNGDIVSFLPPFSGG